MRIKYFLAILFLFGCRPTSPDSSSQQNAVELPKTETTAKIEAPEKTSIKPLEKDQITDFVDQWIEVQNGGDFDGYKKLYGEKFKGIKRVGSKTSKYEFEAWLEDRSRMFQKPMKVGVKSLHITIDGERATARFVQSWESGKFRDVGPKELIVERIDGRLFLIHEEMVRSTSMSGQNAAKLSLADLGGAHKVLAFTSDLILVEPRGMSAGFCEDGEEDCSRDWMDQSKELNSEIESAEIDPVEAQTIFDILSSPESYGAPIAACHYPRLTLAFYHKDEHLPFATIGICIDCANADSWPHIKGLHARLPEDTPGYGLSAIPEIRTWCKKQGLKACTTHKPFYEDGI